jgi:hypothetical protein
VAHPDDVDAWRRFVRACRDTEGVGTRATASAAGLHPSTWRRRCAREGWAFPYAGVAIAPWARHGEVPALAAVAAAHGGALAGATARWRHDLGGRPRVLEVVIPHATPVRAVRPDPPPVPPLELAVSDAEAAAHAAARAEREDHRRWHARCRRITVRRCRWLRPDDVSLVGGVPVLGVAATAISLAATAPDELRAFLVDARHAGAVDLAEVRTRLADVGPVASRHLLTSTLDDLEGRRPESIFHDEVLTELQRRGYRPATAPMHLPTPRGRPVSPDIPLPDWQVAIETDGDRYHRDRDARRRDRERQSAYASSTWRCILVDHQTWTTAREQVFADIDAAIASQRRLGIGADVEPPRSDV